MLGFMTTNKMCLIMVLFSLSLSSKGQSLLVRKEFEDAARKLSVDEYKKKHKKHLRELRKHPKPDALIIYWMVYTGDSATISKSSSQRLNTIFSNLAFTLQRQPASSLKDTVKQTVFSSLIFDCDNDSLLATLSEAKYIYPPSLPDEALFNVAKEVGAKHIFHIMNLFDNWPYFIVDKDNRIVVHYGFIKIGEKNYTYRTLPVEDFFSSNEDVIKFTKSDWLIWR
jgi:hypothetical protein